MKGQFAKILILMAILAILIAAFVLLKNRYDYYNGNTDELYDIFENDNSETDEESDYEYDYEDEIEDEEDEYIDEEDLDEEVEDAEEDE